MAHTDKPALSAQDGGGVRGTVPHRTRATVVPMQSHIRWADGDNSDCGACNEVVRYGAHLPQTPFKSPLDQRALGPANRSSATSNL